MKTSQCQCGNRIFFENSLCQNCNSELGFLPDEGVMSALSAVDEEYWKAAHNQKTYHKCKNYREKASCNWMVPDTESQLFCLSCRLSEIIPDLGKVDNYERWVRIERAKRRLIYNLLWLDLPLVDKQSDPANGLSFQLMEDQEHYSEFAATPLTKTRVMTGHKNGIITLNIEEADSALQEQIKTRMQESYRTLLGHLRHESGHYYWDILVRNTELLHPFRELFGDETQDYSAALQSYYTNGPKENWQQMHISAYASAHPWEDWAECWAHYLHMVDTMETAYDFAGDVYLPGKDLKGQSFNKKLLQSMSIEQLVDEWSRLAIFINEMSRSLGLVDAYPFYLSGALEKKMAFLHKIIVGK